MSDETSKPKPETWSDVRELYLEDMKPKAEKVMNDERLNFFRTRIRRRILAGASLVVGLLMVMMISSNVEGNWLLKFYCALLTYLVLISFGSYVARGFMSLPHEFVDERVLQRRHESYRYAFYLGLAIIPVILIIYILMREVLGRGILEPTPSLALVGFWVLMSGLPTIAFLWREPEL